MPCSSFKLVVSIGTHYAYIEHRHPITVLANARYTKDWGQTFATIKPPRPVEPVSERLFLKSDRTPVTVPNPRGAGPGVHITPVALSSTLQ